jgi:predicted nucleotidyltransferase
MPDSLFVEARNLVVERLRQAAQADARIIACWLQGSLASGAADDLSDIDACVTVDDVSLDQFLDDRDRFCGTLGTLLFLTAGTVPGNRIVHCLFDGPVKLDLLLLKASEVDRGTRAPIVMLVDKAGVSPRLLARPEEAAPEVGPRIQALYGIIRQGGMWPIRLLVRGQWSMFGMCELELISDNLAALMAARHDPKALGMNRLSLPLSLPSQQQAELDELSTAVVAALARRDLALLREVHLRIFDALVREGRAALSALGLPYPGTVEGDAGLRELYIKHWPQHV